MISEIVTEDESRSPVPQEPGIFISFTFPVNALLALLGAWFGIVYAGLAFVAFFNFIYAFQLATMPG